jgi:hypothetical protein
MSPLVFISYVREDVERAQKLSNALRSKGLRTWIDIENLVPGERWENAIQKALKNASFIVVCLSKTSVKKRGFAQRELKHALYAEEGMLVDDIYLLPIRFDSCEIPQPLLDFQVLEIKDENDFLIVANSILEGCHRRGITVTPTPAPTAEKEALTADLSDLGGGDIFSMLFKKNK